MVTSQSATVSPPTEHGRWPTTRLGDLLEFQNGVNAPKSAYGSGTPFINVLEVITRTTIREPDIAGSVRVGDATRRSASVLPQDILFNRTSETPEEIAMAARYEGHRDAIFGGFVIRGRPKDGRLVTAFAVYALRAHQVRKQLIALGQGAIRGNIGQRSLSQVLIDLPDEPEQRAIARALADADALIESLERLIEKKRRIKEGAMQELLTGKRRLPGFDGEWENKLFSDLVHLINERTPMGVDAGAQMSIELEHIVPGEGVIAGISDAINSRSQKARFRAGDILFGRLRAYLRKYWLADRPGVCSTEIWVLRPTARADANFVYNLVQTQDFIDAASVTYGTHMPRSDWKVVGNLTIMVPSVPEQAAVGQLLRNMENEIRALATYLTKARQIKEGMMQELLTGRMRLL